MNLLSTLRVICSILESRQLTDGTTDTRTGCERGAVVGAIGRLKPSEVVIESQAPLIGSSIEDPRFAGRLVDCHAPVSPNSILTVSFAGGSGEPPLPEGLYIRVP
jgi:hypothetical protein